MTVFLTIVWSILSKIGSFLGAVISKVPWQVWAFLAAFLLGGWVFYGGSCRDFACSKTKVPRPIKVITDEYKVVKALNGITLEVSTGRKRTTTVTLANVVSPSSSKLAEDSKLSLEKAAGPTIKITHQKSGLIFKGEAICPECDGSGNNQYDETVECWACSGSKVLKESLDVETREIVESRGPKIGVVFGSNGECLQIVQLTKGMVKLQVGAKDIPKEWLDAEKQARKLKQGLWFDKFFEEIK